MLNACHCVHTVGSRRNQWLKVIFRDQGQKSLAAVDNRLCFSTIVSMESLAAVELSGLRHLSTARLGAALLYVVPFTEL